MEIPSAGENRILCAPLHLFHLLGSQTVQNIINFKENKNQKSYYLLQASLELLRFSHSIKLHEAKQRPKLFITSSSSIKRREPACPSPKPKTQERENFAELGR